MNLGKFESVISQASLFFCRADRFKDKWEGVFPVKMIEKFGLADRQIPSSDGNTYTSCQWQMQKEARSHLINCWHANDHESFAMWKIYTEDEHPSIAIQSTVNRLKRSFRNPADRVWIGEVEYIDFRTWEPDNRVFNVTTPNTLKAFFMKWHYFKYENEIRAVINRAYSEHRSEIGIHVSTDVGELVENIYLSADTTDAEESSIRQLLKRYSYSFPVHRSDLGIRVYMMRDGGKIPMGR